jgi:hypothetical protein
MKLASGEPDLHEGASRAAAYAPHNGENQKRCFILATSAYHFFL